MTSSKLPCMASTTGAAHPAALDTDAPEHVAGAAPGERRPPWRGLTLLAISAAFSAALLVYFGAWSAAERVDARGLTLASRTEVIEPGEAWWEDSLLWVCPLH